MELFTQIYFWWAVGTLVLVVLVTGNLALHSRELVPLTTEPALDREEMPRVSIVIAGRNEERDIERGIDSLLALDYPNLELIAVNDRSTDRTGEILDHRAAGDSRLKVVHVTELPPNWLGKCHAMHLGAAQASGEYILFTDADCVFDPATVRRGVGFLQRTGFDHLALLPECRMPSLFLEAFVTTFAIFFTLFLRPWAAKDPNSSAFIGVGAFNLIRSSTYRAIGGHEPIRMRPDDDIMLGKLLKKHGFRQDVMIGAGSVWVPWYATINELIVGLEKNAFAGVEYSVPMVVGSSLALFFLNVWPFVGMCIPLGWAQLLYAIASALLLFNFGATAINGGTRWWLAPLYPLAVLLFIYIQWRSMTLTFWNGGIRWRDTLYPLKELMENTV